MEFLSVSLSVKDRKCLIIGSQPQAVAMAQSLSSRQAHVVVVSRQPIKLAADIVVCERGFSETDLDDCWLVFAASESTAENLAIKRSCDTRHLFCSMISDDTNSSWLATGVQSNSAARAALVGNSSELRTGAEATTIGSFDTRSETTAEAGTGVVSLVGAGPGDPELLTVGALRRIQNADAIVYDRLVSKPILDLCNQDAEFVYAGKAKANHALPQNSINELLVELARKHKHVVRLKGGDPFIFGRGGEEIETLADEQVEFEVVPGITAASGCAAFSGIPLTHRDHAQSCIFVTGHLRNGTINLNWQELTDPQQTIVVYMGLTGLDAICDSLIQHGRSAETPAALIEQGTKPQQRVLASTLDGLPELVAQSDVSAPTLLIIGGVVSLREKLKWFGSSSGRVS